MRRHADAKLPAVRQYASVAAAGRLTSGAGLLHKKFVKVLKWHQPLFVTGSSGCSSFLARKLAFMCMLRIQMARPSSG